MRGFSPEGVGVQSNGYPKAKERARLGIDSAWNKVPKILEKRMNDGERRD